MRELACVDLFTNTEISDLKDVTQYIFPGSHSVINRHAYVLKSKKRKNLLYKMHEHASKMPSTKGFSNPSQAEMIQTHPNSTVLVSFFVLILEFKTLQS